MQLIWIPFCIDGWSAHIKGDSDDVACILKVGSEWFPCVVSSDNEPTFDDIEKATRYVYEQLEENFPDECN